MATAADIQFRLRFVLARQPYTQAVYEHDMDLLRAGVVTPVDVIERMPVTMCWHDHPPLEFPFPHPAREIAWSPWR